MRNHLIGCVHIADTNGMWPDAHMSYALADLSPDCAHKQEFDEKPRLLMHKRKEPTMFHESKHYRERPIMIPGHPSVTPVPSEKLWFHADVHALSGAECCCHASLLSNSAHKLNTKSLIGCAHIVGTKGMWPDAHTSYHLADSSPTKKANLQWVH